MLWLKVNSAIIRSAVEQIRPELLVARCELAFVRCADQFGRDAFDAS
jgi:hypothetical protein